MPKLRSGFSRIWPKLTLVCIRSTSSITASCYIPNLTEPTTRMPNPAIPSTATAAVAGCATSTGHSVMKKERRGMSMKNHLPPLRLPDAAAKCTTQSGPNGCDVVRCRLAPDADGRFGFNVQGGADLNSTVIVTHVSSKTPTTTGVAEPSLHEGDEIISVNGTSTRTLTHEQVVAIIRDGCRSSNDGKLELLVRSSATCNNNAVAANRSSCAATVGSQQHTNLLVRQAPPPPLFAHAVEQMRHLGSGNSSSFEQHSVLNESCEADVKTLSESIKLLRQALNADSNLQRQSSALDSFENLDRKNPDMSMARARRSCNVSKNRYQDVLPYDSTRVRVRHSSGTSNSTRRLYPDLNALCASLKEQEIARTLVTPEPTSAQTDCDDDYINANYIRMAVPASGVVNNYIATQGPLPSTTACFWRMIMQEDTNLVVMLTQLSEQLRQKCHKYWPDLNVVGGSFDCGNYLHITCQSERHHDAYIEREMLLRDSKTGEKRHVTHLQYVAWPDHGVPANDSIQFLDFVGIVRQKRHGTSAPMVIHCSAGIGRTGVLILMETAMCLIEANQPVRPLEIVRTMRNQRGMLIQTGCQYEFVLQCILRAYDEKLVLPLEEFADIMPNGKVETLMANHEHTALSNFTVARDAATIPVYHAQMHDIRPATPQAGPRLPLCAVEQEPEDDGPLTARCTAATAVPISAATTPQVTGHTAAENRHVRMFSWSSAFDNASKPVTNVDKTSERERLCTQDSSSSRSNFDDGSDASALESSIDSRCGRTSSSSSSRSSSNNSSAGGLASASDRASSRMSTKIPPSPPLANGPLTSAMPIMRSPLDQDGENQNNSLLIKVDVFERTRSTNNSGREAGKSKKFLSGNHHRRLSPTITPSSKNVSTMPYFSSRTAAISTPEVHCVQKASGSASSSSHGRVLSAEVQKDAGRFRYYYRAPPPLPRQPHIKQHSEQPQYHSSGLQRQTQFRSSAQHYNQQQQQYHSAPATASVVPVVVVRSSSASASPSLLSLVSCIPPSPPISKSRKSPPRILSGTSAGRSSNYRSK